MATEKVEFEVSIKANSSDLKKAGNSFAEQVAKSLEKNLNRIGLGSLASGGGKGGGTSDATKMGVAAGLAVAGVSAGISLIVDILKDFPIITAIMKMLKFIIMLLLLPLIPILKPVLQLLGIFAKAMMPWMKAIQKGIDAFMGATFKPIMDFLALLGGGIGAVGDLLWKYALKGWEVIKDIGKYLYEFYLKPAFEWLYNYLTTKGWSILKDVGKWIWNNIIIPGWNILKDVGKWIWDNIIKPGWNYLVSVGSWIWNQIIKPAFDFLSNVGTKIWNIIKTPFDWLKSVLDAIVSAIQNIGNKLRRWLGMSTTTVGDAIITPSGVVNTSPQDYIIATKNPKGLGGGMTVNINIDKPMLTGQADIKTLVKAIELELYKMQRRYNSYV